MAKDWRKKSVLAWSWSWLLNRLFLSKLLFFKQDFLSSQNLSSKSLRYCCVLSPLYFTFLFL